MHLAALLPVILALSTATDARLDRRNSSHRRSLHAGHHGHALEARSPLPGVDASLSSFPAGDDALSKRADIADTSSFFKEIAQALKLAVPGSTTAQPVVGAVVSGGSTTSAAEEQAAKEAAEKKASEEAAAKKAEEDAAAAKAKAAAVAKAKAARVAAAKQAAEEQAAEEKAAAEAAAKKKAAEDAAIAKAKKEAAEKKAAEEEAARVEEERQAAIAAKKAKAAAAKAAEEKAAEEEAAAKAAAKAEAKKKAAQVKVAAVSKGNNLIGFASGSCGNSGATNDEPNGSQDWLNCGISKSSPDSGWNPPVIKINQLKTVSLEEAIASNSVWEPCRQFIKLFEKIGAQTDLPPILLASFALQESTCNPNVVGGGGEVGLMQITEDKCGGRGRAACADPEYNVLTAAQYFRSSLNDYGGSFLQAVGIYNGWTPGMSYKSATAAAYGGCCRCQNNLDYPYQMLNGWLLGRTGYTMKRYDNLAVCG